MPHLPHEKRIGPGPLSDGDRLAYQAVLSQAFDVHVDREAIRHGLWKEYPATDQLAQIKIKVERAMRIMSASEESGHDLTAGAKHAFSEEMLDIINYAIFAHRIINGRI